jgi:hypothetical protein
MSLGTLKIGSSTFLILETPAAVPHTNATMSGWLDEARWRGWVNAGQPDEVEILRPDEIGTQDDRQRQKRRPFVRRRRAQDDTQRAGLPHALTRAPNRFTPSQSRDVEILRAKKTARRESGKERRAELRCVATLRCAKVKGTVATPLRMTRWLPRCL